MMLKKITILIVLLSSLFFLQNAAFASTFLVTNTLDAGTGSLRQAMVEANNNYGPDTIAFNIPISEATTEGGVTFCRIEIATSLPTISSEGTVIDGTTQTLNQGDSNPQGPEIVIDGSNMYLSGGPSSYAPAIEITAANNIVKGLVINNVSKNGTGGTGIMMDGASAINNRIYGCYLGLEASGEVGACNLWSAVYILDGAKNNIVGSNEATNRNVISGNTNTNGYGGICISGFGSTNNTIIGNYIGTNWTGTAAVGNYFGVTIRDGAQSNVVGGALASEGNIISCARQAGIAVYGDGTKNNVVKGNYIGTDVTGMVDLGNAFYGVLVSTNAQNNIIGGSSRGDRNIISGNNSCGVYILGAGTNSNEVKNNYIGTNASGTASLGNASFGIEIYASEHNIIGTTGAGNVISGNRNTGIYIWGNGANGSRNIVKGNFVGTRVDGTVAVGNTNGGIALGSSYNVIGGTAAGEKNIISGNTGYGIAIAGLSCASNEVKGNYVGTDINGTANLGNMADGIEISGSAKYNLIGDGNIIAFNGDGVNEYGVKVTSAGGNATNYNTITQNSIFSNSSKGIALIAGGNLGIAAPTILYAQYNPLTGTSVVGTAQALATIEVFADSGRTYITTTSTDISGNWLVVLADISSGIIAATVTSIEGTFGNTSEFATKEISFTEPSVASITLKDRLTGSSSYTNSLLVTLEASGMTGDTYQMISSQESSFKGAVWVSYQNPTSYYLTPGDSYKTVYYKLRNHALVESSTVSSSITLIQNPPENVRNFIATAMTDSIILNWDNSNNGYYEGCLVRHKNNGYPTSVYDGELTTNEVGRPAQHESYVHAGLTIGETYFYKAYAYDFAKNYAGGVTVEATLTTTTSTITTTTTTSTITTTTTTSIITTTTTDTNTTTTSTTTTTSITTTTLPNVPIVPISIIVIPSEYAGLPCATIDLQFSVRNKGGVIVIIENSGPPPSVIIQKYFEVNPGNNLVGLTLVSDYGKILETGEYRWKIIEQKSGYVKSGRVIIL